MNEIENAVVMDPALGDPVLVPDEKANTLIPKDASEETRRKLFKTMSMTTGYAIRFFLVNAFRFGGNGANVTFNDTHHGARVLDGIRRAEKAQEQPAPIKLEDEDYEWLRGCLKEKGPSILGLVMDPVYDAVNAPWVAQEAAKAKKSQAT